MEEYKNKTCHMCANFVQHYFMGVNENLLFAPCGHCRAINENCKTVYPFAKACEKWTHAETKREENVKDILRGIRQELRAVQAILKNRQK